MQKREEVIEFCFKEMFLRVGEKYPNKDLTKHSEWYTMRSWTVAEEEKFRKWMVSFLRKRLRITIKAAGTIVASFLLCYGWTNKYELKMKVGHG